MTVEREGEHRELPCQGLVVGQVRIDYAYGLEFTETPERTADVTCRLRIGTKFLFTDAAGNQHRMDPEGPAESLGPALVARHQQLVSSDLRSSGPIRLVFGNGCVLDIAPDDRYEAWTLSSNGRFVLVCLPGGGLAEWH